MTSRTSGTRDQVGLCINSHLQHSCGVSATPTSEYTLISTADPTERVDAHYKIHAMHSIVSISHLAKTDFSHPVQVSIIWWISLQARCFRELCPTFVCPTCVHVNHHGLISHHIKCLARCYWLQTVTCLLPPAPPCPALPTVSVYLIHSGDQIKAHTNC